MNFIKTQEFKTNNSILRIFFFLLIIFLPSNLFLSFFSSTAFVRGLQIDYLIPKLYASQIIALNIFWIGLIGFKHKHWQSLKKVFSSNKWLITLTAILIVRQFFTPWPLASIWFLGQLGLSVAMFFFLNKNDWLLKTVSFYWSIFLSLLIQFFLAVSQFIQQKPLLPYYVFGEPRFEPYFRISRHLFDGKEKILAYGSTPHPNILAGVAVIFFLILLGDTVKKPSIINLLRGGVALLATTAILYFTQSLSALLVLLFGGVMIILLQFIRMSVVDKYKQHFFWIVLSIAVIATPISISKLTDYYPNENSITRRNLLNKSALIMIADKWLFGVGLNQFTGVLENYSSSTETVRFVQPAHHAGLLLLAEGGLLIVIILALLLKTTNKKTRVILLKSLLLISPILVLDHYLYTLQIGQLLVVVLLIHQLELARELE